MKITRVTYREEDDGAWIGTSPDYPGYVGHGESYEEARERVQEGLPWFAEAEMLIFHVLPDDGDGGNSTEGVNVSLGLSREPALPTSEWSHEFSSAQSSVPA